MIEQFIRCRGALSRSSLPGLFYSLNPYVGCSHGCVYCYSASTLGDPELARRWGEIVKVKENIVEVLGREVSVKKRETVGVSTVTDPYQPIEKRLELTRRCIEILSRHDFPVSIQTKSDLVLRDADIILKGKFDVGVTITTMDPSTAKIIEPGAPPPDARAWALEEFASRGVETWLFLGPIIPGVNDSRESIEDVVKVAARTKSKVIYDRLNLRKWVMERLGPRLDEHFGGKDRVLALLRDPSYLSRISSEVGKKCLELGVKCEPAF
ncbi:MAG: radical SAM protein [Candidatus Hadarchaeales archaeon]